MFFVKSLLLKFSSFIIILTSILAKQDGRLRLFLRTLRNQLPIPYYQCLTTKFAVSLPITVLLYGLYKSMEAAKVFDLAIFQINIFMVICLATQALLGSLILCEVFRRVTGVSFFEQLGTLKSVLSSVVRTPQALLISLPVLNG